MTTRKKRWLIDRATRKPMQFNNSLVKCNYPYNNIVFVDCSSGYYDTDSKPYILDLDSQITYPISVPEQQFRFHLQAINYSTEWFTINVSPRWVAGRYTVDSDKTEDTLRRMGYACKENEIYYTYDDILSGRQKTSMENFDVDKAYDIIHGDENLNESVVKITKNDIKEMVIAACRLILENKK